MPSLYRLDIRQAGMNWWKSCWNWEGLFGFFKGYVSSAKPAKNLQASNMF